MIIIIIAITMWIEEKKTQRIEHRERSNKATRQTYAEKREREKMFILNANNSFGMHRVCRKIVWIMQSEWNAQHSNRNEYDQYQICAHTHKDAHTNEIFHVRFNRAYGSIGCKCCYVHK